MPVLASEDVARRRFSREKRPWASPFPQKTRRKTAEQCQNPGLRCAFQRVCSRLGVEALIWIDCA